MASTYRRAVGIFSSRPQTASALQALNDSGFSMGDVSIIAKDADRQKDIAGISIKDEVTNQAHTGGAVGAATGGILGGVTGLLVGLGTLTIPGLGPALLAGEAAVVISTLVGGAAGAAAGGLVGVLIGLGIPQHRAERYRERVHQGDYLVMLKGSEEDIARAEHTLTSSGIEDWGVYPVTDEPRQVRPKGDRGNVNFNDGVVVGDRRDLNPNDRPADQRLSDRRDSNLSTGPLVEFVGFDSDPQSAVGLRVPETVTRDRQTDLRSKEQGNLYGEPRRDTPAGVQQPDRGLPGERYPTAGLPHSSNPIDDRNFRDSAEGDRPRAMAHAEERRVVGVFLNRDRMEAALAQLQQTGFPMHTLSMAVREAEAPDQRQDYYSHSLAGVTRLTAGLDRIVLPEVGTVLVMGPDAQALANTFVSSAQGSGYDSRANRAENGATDLGIAPESANLYRRHLTSGAYLVTLRGNNQDLLQVATTLGESGMHDWGIYDVSYTGARF